jgi:uncharacterized protein (TIGR02594 family)
MPEQQELQLVLSAVDNATPKLSAFKREFEDWGKSSKRATDQISTGVSGALKEINKFAGSVTGLPLGQFARIAEEATKGIGGFTTALALVPAALWEANNALKEFSDRMTSLKLHAESIGLLTGEMKALSDQMTRMANIPTAQGQQMVSSVVTWIARAQRAGTAERASLGRLFANPGEVLTQIAGVSGQGPAAQFNFVRHMLLETEARQRQRLEQGFGGRPGISPQAARTQAAVFTEEIARSIGLGPEWREITKDLQEATKEQIDKAEEQSKAADDIKRSQGELALAIRDWTDQILEIVRGPMTELNKQLADFLNQHPLEAMGIALAVALPLIWRFIGVLRGLAAIGAGGGAAAAGGIGAGAAAAGGAAGGAGARSILRLPNLVGAGSAYLLEEIIRAEAAEGRRQAQEQAKDPNLFTRQLEEAAKGKELPGGRGVPPPEKKWWWPFQHGGIVRGPTMGLLGEAGPEAVIPLGAGLGAADAGREHNKLLYENTDELRKLNDFLTKPEQRTGRAASAAQLGLGTGSGSIQLPGGGGSGAAPGGGGVPGGALGGALLGGGGIGGIIGGMLGGGVPGGAGIGLPGIGRVLGPGGGMGVRAGAGAAAAAGGDGGQPEARTPGITGDPTVPSNILATAQHVALQGGPGAVSEFMRQQGYPKDGPWCGEFAASVVKAAGFTPPKNAAVASNWRTFGEPVVGPPQPGDIAVANRGVRTGDPGSHVTFVEGYNPKTGTFTGLGGNQRSGFESTFKASGYSFRRPVAGDAKAASAVSTLEGGAGGGAGAGGRGADLYRKLLAGFQGSSVVGVVPRGGEQFGIRTGSAEEWARFALSVAHAESGFKPGTKNLTDPGGSFGIFQYAHSQVPGGNAYDVDASVKAFVRDAEKSAVDPRGLRGGILGQRFSTIGRHPERGAEYLSQAARLTDGSALDRHEQTHRVEGTGRLDVHVNAPAGTHVRARGGGLFKQTRLTRQTQMPLMEAGPAGPASIA